MIGCVPWRDFSKRKMQRNASMIRSAMGASVSARLRDVFSWIVNYNRCVREHILSFSVSHPLLNAHNIFYNQCVVSCDVAFFLSLCSSALLTNSLDKVHAVAWLFSISIRKWLHIFIYGFHLGIRSSCVCQRFYIQITFQLKTLRSVVCHSPSSLFSIALIFLY